MASVTGTVRHPKGPVELGPNTNATTFARSALDSSVGSKVLIALTGSGLVLFVLFHMIGNLKLLQGPDAINGYAYFLKHDLGALIWIARAGLLTIFVLHLALAIRLKLRSKAARPIPYAFPGSAQATAASQTMIWTGIVILLFTLFHLAHFTFGLVSEVQVTDPNTKQQVWTNYLNLTDAKGHHNVYEMMVAGFSNVPLAILYLLAQIGLFVHLRHAIPSVFQTLGLKNARFRRSIDILGLGLALAVLLGNGALVLAVKFGAIHSLLSKPA